MAAEKPDKIKEKKDKKKKRSEEAGVSKASKANRKEKKEKKEKLAAAVQDQLQREDGVAEKKPAVADDSDAEQPTTTSQPLQRTVVPFAIPISDEKGMKKTYKTIRKAAKNGTLKRGVKEVIKALRKSPPSAPGYTGFPGVVVIAGDISPPDVIAHIPVLCEDHNVPFIFVTSRAELGASARTKRPTSVVMLMEKRDAGKKKEVKDKEADAVAEEAEAYAEAYAALVKYMHKEYAKQAFWAKGDSKG
ncbi:hypothetical protein L249_2003 [Ophiocordyceps polyrhachis-furcata BCC 54312]|uniref:Ribosomal protein eL8/eL30/eS12/Gadd45 domain-containing protein n=1 Tax=Ophiocordyceps polyrhachis-furcata BCC 54312 TaxID=1330021 RepID=A0A367LQR9_9HYPO|nr:hypothetical protein L249_2003 [Ophiocordyceps polyrhachis-furcata BCC 54312]